MNLKLLRRKIRYGRKKYFVYAILCALLLSLGIGYSYLTASLAVNGVSKFSNSTWDIHLDNSTIDIDSGSVSPISAPSATATNLSFSTRLENQGDYYSFTIDVVNGGTIDATLSNFTLTPVLSNDVSKYLTFVVTYDDDTPLTIGDELGGGESKTLKVLARYNSGLDVEEYPIIDETYNFNLQLDYTQS